MVIDCLYDELIHLCEIRGELDEEANRRTEQKIAEIQAKIDQEEAALHAADPRSHGPDWDA